MKRLNRIGPPAHLSKSPPVPAPKAIEDVPPPAGEDGRLEPTRYGDWEDRGIAVDF